MSRVVVFHIQRLHCFMMQQKMCAKVSPEKAEERNKSVVDVTLYFVPLLLQIIKKLIERKQAQIRKVYPGLSCFKEGVRQIPIESIPGIRTSYVR